MEQLQQLINGDKPLLIDFYATWCGPCKMLHPVLEEVKQQLGDTATIIKIDVDEHPDIAAQFGVNSIPNLFLYKKGELIWHELGFRPKEQLLEVIGKAI